MSLESDLISDIAASLSRALNLHNSNDLLAKRVIQLARNEKTPDGFRAACLTFGRFSDSFLTELHQRVANYDREHPPDTVVTPVQQTQQSEVLIMGNNLPGGLIRPNKSSTSDDSRPIFAIPAPKPSLLGLDRLAQQKKAETAKLADEADNRASKKIRLDSVDGWDTAGDDQNGIENELGTKKKEKREYTQYRHSNRIETPSHPGGVSEEALKRMEELKRKDRNKGSAYRGLKEDGRDQRHLERERDMDKNNRSRSRNLHDRNKDGSGDRGRDESRDGNRDENSSRSSTGSRTSQSSHSAGSSTGSRRSGLIMRSDWDSTPLPDSSFTPRTGAGGMTPRREYTAPRTTKKSEWDFETPQIRPTGYDEMEVQYPGENALPEDGLKQEWEEEQTQLDRDWYDMEETGAVDDTHNPFAEYTDLDQKKEAELANRQLKKLSARQAQYNKDADMWETSRMLQSGVVQRREVDTDFDDEDENRVHLLVHDIKPPFLDGRMVFTRQLEAVQHVRDPTSDMAVFSRKGSKLVKEKREESERKKAAPKFELAGTAMGNVMGIKAEESSKVEEQSNRAADEDPKGNSKFASHLKNSEAASQFSRSKTIREQREYLPVFAVREELLKVVRDNQVIVIVGETGSGKTTQLTQYLHEDGYSNFGMIGCTQPRRVAAMSVAKRVAEEMECKLGTTVGYAIRFEDQTSSETIIKYMTDGILLRESLTEPDLDRYSAIIMDEAHERMLNTDVLMGLLRKVLARRRDLKLIVTSATMNAERFSQFFSNAATFNIPGRTFPVEIMFHKTSCEDYVDSAVKQALAVHLSQPVGDILIFMTGQEDIEITCQVLNERMAQLENPPPLAVLPIYSQMPADLQAKIFEKASDNARKAIVATNIAETSLTVDGIIYVIDSGYCKLKVYNPKIGMDALQVTPISQANANQRSGRAGRTGPGTCYRLYTEQAYRYEMFTNAIPEIQRINLSMVVLLLKSLGVKNLLEFDFMDPPPQDNILNSMYQLWVLGALDNLGDLTPLGRKMVEFPLDPSLAKMLITAEEMNCTAEVLTIVSMLSVPSVFYRPKERVEESDAAREKFFVPESDHLTLLHVYTQWKSNNYRDDWCIKHFIHPKAMRKAREVRSQLIDIMKSIKMPYISCGTDWDVIRKCICSGYFHQAARIKGIGEYVNCRTGMPCHLHPTSALFGAGFTPDYVVYHELIYTSKEYMQCVTSVDPYWLAEIGPMFFSVREKNYSHTEKRGLIKASEAKMSMELEMKQAREREEKEEAEQKAREISQAARNRIATPGFGAARTPRRRTGI